MASIVTSYGSDLWTKILFDLEAVPTNYYVALCESLPDEEGDGTDLAGIEPADGYARLQTPTNSTYWATNADGLVTNASLLTFPNPTADWGRLEAYALCTALTGGEVICAGEFSQPLYIRLGVPARISAGGLSFGLATQADTISV
jgi:hypothetical protein